eukprot:403373621
MSNYVFNVQSPSVSISNYNAQNSHYNYRDNEPQSQTPSQFQQQNSSCIINPQSQQLQSHHHRYQTNINDYNSPILIQNSANGKSNTQHIKVHFENNSDIIHLQSVQQSGDTQEVQDEIQNYDDELILYQYFQQNPHLYNQFIASQHQFNDQESSLIQNQNASQDQENIVTAGAGLTKTKSYNNWKKENIVDSMILKENSAMFNLVVASKIPEDFQYQGSPSLMISPKNLYEKYYDQNMTQNNGGMTVPNNANLSTIQKPPQHPNHNKKGSINIEGFDLTQQHDHTQNLRKRKLSQFKNLSQISNVFPSPKQQKPDENYLLKQQVMALTNMIEKLNDNQSQKMQQFESTFKFMQNNLQDELEKMRMGGKSHIMMTPHSHSQHSNCKSIPVTNIKFTGQHQQNINNSSSNNQQTTTSHRTPNQSQQLFDLSISQQSKHTPITNQKQIGHAHQIKQQKPTTQLQDIHEDQENSNPNIILQNHLNIQDIKVDIDMYGAADFQFQESKKKKKKKVKKANVIKQKQILDNLNNDDLINLTLQKQQEYFNLQTTQSIDNLNTVNVLVTELDDQRIQFFTEEVEDESTSKQFEKIISSAREDQGAYEREIQLKNKHKQENNSDKQSTGNNISKEKGENNSSCKCLIF